MNIKFPEGNVDRWYKCSIDKKVLKDLSRRSDWQGIKHILIWATILVFSGYMAFLTWGTWWCVFWFLVYGNIYLFSDPIRHECGHRNAFKSRWLNECFYYLTSFMFNYEPIRWRWSHFHHHTYTLHTKEHYDHEIQVTKPTDLLWLFIYHLPLGNLFFYKSNVAFHLETIKHALGIKTQVVKDCVPPKEYSKLGISARIFVLFWILIISSSIYFTTWLPVLYLLLPFIYGSTLIHSVHFVQHAGLANNVMDHRLTTRSLKLNPILNFLCWNMEYHLEHHMYPMVPAYNLKKLHNAVKDQMPKPKNGFLDAYKEILPAIFKQAYDPDYRLEVKLPNI